MATSQSPDPPATNGRGSLLDDWRAEVGDEEIARIAGAARRDAESGLAPSFTDRESLLAYMRAQATPPG